MISIAADYLMLVKMTYFPFEKQPFEVNQMINDLFISRRKEVHSAGHSVYRPAKMLSFYTSLFFLFLK